MKSFAYLTSSRRLASRVLAGCLSLSTLLPTACAPTKPQEPIVEEPAQQLPTGRKPWATSAAVARLRANGIVSDPLVRAKLRSQARKAGHDQLQEADLDLNGDGLITRKEIQFVLSWKPEQLQTEGRYRLVSRPRLLPNRLVGGMIQIQVNNPEQVQDPGLLFDSRQLNSQPGALLSGEASLHLGQGDQRSFDLFTYTNFALLRQRYAGKPGPDGAPLTRAWYTLAIHNPSQNGAVTLTMAGSGNLNQPNPTAANQMLARLPYIDDDEKLAAAERINHPTRSNDAELQYRMLHPERHALTRAFTLSPGYTTLVYTSLPFNQGLQDYRGEFQFQVQDTELSQPLQVQAAVLTSLPGAPGNDNGVLSDIAPNSFSIPLRDQLSRFVAPKGSNETLLRQASDMLSPRALSGELYRRQLPNLRRFSQSFDALKSRLGGSYAELPDWLTGKAALVDDLKTELSRSSQRPDQALDPFLASRELQEQITRGEALAQDLAQAQSFNEPLLRRIRGWNAEIKMLQRILSAPENLAPISPSLKAVLGAAVNPLWSTLFTLGRVNGVVRGNQISSTLPATDLVLAQGQAGQEWNYVFNTNPFTAGGAAAGNSSLLNQSDAVAMIRQSSNVASPPALSFGNYGIRYRIEGKMRNESDTPQPYDIRIGSPDELGHLDWRSLFDQTDTLLGETSTRFTGTLKLTLAPSGEPVQVKEFSLIHGRVQSPESLVDPASRLAPGQELKAVVEVVVPTNSTAPQLLQFKAGTPAE